MQILTIEPKDIAQIKPLWEELNAFHGNLSTHFQEMFSGFDFTARMKQLNDRDASVVLLSRDGDRPIGYCIASVKEDSGEVDSIFVAPSHRGTGLGLQLMEAAEEWLVKQKVTVINVVVVEENDHALGFYQKKGYLPRFRFLEKRLDPPK